MEAWLLALEGSAFADALKRSFYVYPTINALHILGIAFLIGAITPLDLRLLGLYRTTRIGALAHMLVPIAAGGLALAIVAGALLFVVQPLDYVGNPPFLAKIGLVALGTLNALAVRIGPAWRIAITHGVVGARLKLQSLASLAIWVAAIFAGRWIAFVDG